MLEGEVMKRLEQAASFAFNQELKNLRKEGVQVTWEDLDKWYEYCEVRGVYFPPITAEVALKRSK